LFAKLTQEQQKQLYGWIANERITYVAVTARLQQAFGVVANSNAVWRWWVKYNRTLLVRPDSPQADEAPAKVELTIRSDRPLDVVLKTETLNP
jgi:transposase